MAASGGFSFVYAAATLVWAESFEDAASTWDRAVERGRGRGASFLHAAGLTWRAHLYHRIGRLREAAADGRAARELVERLDWETLLAPTSLGELPSISG